MNWEDVTSSKVSKVLPLFKSLNNSKVQLGLLLSKFNTFKPLVPKVPIFKDEYMNENIIRPTMSEYKKYRNTMLRVISFSNLRKSYYHIQGKFH